MYQYDEQDRLLSWDAGDGPTDYAYTVDGSLWTKTTPLSETTTYTYDLFGNLTEVSLPSGDVIEYLVDGQNRRIGRKKNGTLVSGYLYEDQLNPVAEVDATDAVVSQFIYGTKSNVPDYMISRRADGERRYLGEISLRHGPLGQRVPSGRRMDWRYSTTTRLRRAW